jgi:large subunit ribosomal protein L32e
MSNDLEVRKALKARKPHFHRQKSSQYNKLAVKWRRPKGLQSKMRLSRKGSPPTPSHGWRSPKSVRGLSALGTLIKMVYTVSDLESVGENTSIVIGSTVGQKKKIQVLEKAQEKGITVLNVKDAAAFIKETQESFEKNKQVKKKKVEDKEAKQKELEKKAEDKKKEETKDDKEGLDKKVDEVEKKDQDKKEKDKSLIKPQ